MDKSKDTFYDTFRAVYGVDYQQTINKLINERRRFEATVLEITKKIKIFGKIWETYTSYTNIITKNFQAGGLQIFLDENETIGFVFRGVDWQQY